MTLQVLPPDPANVETPRVGAQTPIVMGLAGQRAKTSAQPLEFANPEPLARTSQVSPKSVSKHPGTARRFEAQLHRSLASLAPRWTRLQETGSCTVYQRFEWARAIVDHLVTPSMTPLFVEIREEHGFETLMICPLVSIRRGGCTVVQWLDIGVSDYAAPLTAPGLTLSAAELTAIWSAVKAVLPRTDLIEVLRIPGQLSDGPNPLAGLPGVRPSQFHASGVPLEGDPETLIRRLASKSSYRDLSKSRNRLQRLGAVELVVAETDASVDAIFDVLLAHRRDRFQRLGRFDLLARPAVQAFYRACAKSELSTGHVRLFGLYVGGTCISTSYCLVHDGAIHGILLSMSGDAAWKTCSPGLVLAVENMEWARRQGLGFFDFTIGALPYKTGLGAVTKDVYDLQEALSWRGAGLLAGFRLAALAKQRIAERPALCAVLKSARRSLRRKLA